MWINNKANIQRVIEYKNLYVFMVFTKDPYEGQMGPYYSVDMRTGEFRDFAYLELGVFKEVMSMFEQAPRYEEPPKDSLKTRIKKFIDEYPNINTKLR